MAALVLQARTTYSKIAFRAISLDPGSKRTLKAHTGLLYHQTWHGGRKLASPTSDAHRELGMRLAVDGNLAPRGQEMILAFRNFGLENLTGQTVLMVKDDDLIDPAVYLAPYCGLSPPVVPKASASPCCGGQDVARK